MWQTCEREVAYLHIQQVTVQVITDLELWFGHLSQFQLLFGLVRFLRLISH